MHGEVSGAGITGFPQSRFSFSRGEQEERLPKFVGPSKMQPRLGCKKRKRGGGSGVGGVSVWLGCKKKKRKELLWCVMGAGVFACG